MLRELVVRDIKLRYNRSILGVAWSLLVPLAELGILNFVFATVLPLHVPHFVSYLFSGLLPWAWFSSSLLAATVATRQHKDLLQQVGFPAGILPVITITSQFIHFLLALPILFTFLWMDGRPLTFALAALPVVMALQFAFTLGLAYFLAPLEALFHDTQHSESRFAADVLLVPRVLRAFSNSSTIFACLQSESACPFAGCVPIGAHWWHASASRSTADCRRGFSYNVGDWLPLLHALALSHDSGMLMRDAIIVENLGKQYSRRNHNRPRTIHEALASGLRGLRSKEKFWALRELSFRVRRGSMLGVIGRNGAGKSTLLRMLGAVDIPDEGSVKTSGRVGALLTLGAGFHPDLTGRENVFVSGVVHGLTSERSAEAV